MFRNWFQPNEEMIYAPFYGKITKLEEVPDPVFSQKMMGEGVAMTPEEGKVFSPVQGEIVNVAPTKHAIGIRTEAGTDILIHVGLETVSLDGQGFQVVVNPGDVVTLGQLLLTFDLAYIEAHAKSLISPIVITNQQESERALTVTDESNGVAGKTVIATLSK